VLVLPQDEFGIIGGHAHFSTVEGPCGIRFAGIGGILADSLLLAAESGEERSIN
jgi:hypothetical protein